MTLGTIASTATIEVSLPSSLQGEHSLGQISLVLSAPSMGIHDQHLGPVALSGPLGQYHPYSFPIPASVVTALSTKTYGDLSILVQLNDLPNASTVVLIDQLSFGQPTADGGTDASTTQTESGAGEGHGASGSHSGEDRGAGGDDNDLDHDHDHGHAGSGGTGKAGSSGAGTGGNPGSGGSFGAGGAGGMPQSGGASGSNGNGGGGDGDDLGTTVDFILKLPHGVRREDVTLAANGGGVHLANGVKVKQGTGFGAISSVGDNNATRIGVASQVGNIWSTGDVSLANRAEVHGFIETSGTVSQGPHTLVTGPVTTHVDLEPFEQVTWSVFFPSHPHSFEVESRETRVLPPGNYGHVSVERGAHLKLSQGEYTFESLSVEERSFLDIDNTGPVFVYTNRDFRFEGKVQPSQDVSNILFATAATGRLTIDGAFTGVLVAPWADVTLGHGSDGQQFISLFARTVDAPQNMSILDRPFFPKLLCAVDAACSSFCPCSGNSGTCNTDADCQTGTVCWQDNGRRFGFAGGTGACAPPTCLQDPFLGGCGDVGSPCGRCSNDPADCSHPCPSGETCGNGVGARFSVNTTDVCWPLVCATAPNAPQNCGTKDSACGSCDCNALCSTKKCGDAPPDGCTCPGLCKNGETCKSDLDCQSGSVCAFGMGSRFGLASGTNVCWDVRCTREDLTKPNCGYPTDVDCRCPACTPHCDPGATGPDGCGGFCAACSSGQARLPDGQCGAHVAPLPDSGGGLPIALSPIATDPVGAVPGSFAVTDRGTASYSIPLQVPPGRLGMQPTLSLNYTSTKADGMLGRGWSLGGLSSITVCPAIVDREGRAKPPRYLTGDSPFCLDGQTLIKVASNGNDAEYRTEIDSFSRIVAHGPFFVEGVSGYIAPSSFDVFAKDGRILHYGETDNARVKLALTDRVVRRLWALSSIADRSGNVVHVTYRTPQAPGDLPDFAYVSAEILPDSISYGPSPGTADAPTRFVKFNYEDRPDPMWHYTSGVLGYSWERLTGVVTSLNDQVVKTYHVDYEPLRADHQSRITSIRECAPEGKGEVCKGPTTFKYLEAPTTAGPTANFVAGGGTEAVGAITLDIDGDGRDDILAFQYGTVTNLGTTFAQWELAKNPHRTMAGSLEFDKTSAALPNPGAGCINQGSVIDLNQDGKDDIVVLCSGEATVYLSNGSNFERKSLGFSFNGQAHLADLDGDGLKDFYVCRTEGLPGADTPTGSSQATITMYRNLGGSFGIGTPLPLAPTTIRGSCDTVMNLDDDGDGAEELYQMDDQQGHMQRLVPTLGATWDAVGTSPGWASDGNRAPARPGTDYTLVDLNGDGLKDIMIRPVVTPPLSAPPISTFGDVRVEVRMNVGGRFGSREFGVNAPASQIPADVSFLSSFDLDGDGREEAITTAGVFKWVGPNQNLEFEPGASGPGVARADFDGDGYLDQLTFLTSVTMAAPVYTVNFATSTDRNGLLKQITDGIGKQIDITYDPGTAYSSAGCFKSPSPKTLCLRKVTSLVSAHTEKESVVLTDPDLLSTSLLSKGPSYSYTYSDARIGTGGRGWFGFGQRTIELKGLSRTILSYLNTEFLFAGRLSSSTYASVGSVPANDVTAAADTRFESTSYRWATRHGDFLDFPFVDLEDKSFFEGHFSEGSIPLVWQATTSSRSVDEFGTLIEEFVDTFAGDKLEGRATQVSDVHTVNDSIVNDTSNWLIGLVEHTFTESTRGSTPMFTRTMAIHHDALGRVDSTEREPGDPSSTLYRKTAVIERDAFGNVKQACASDSRGDAASRCTIVQGFDPSNIFPKVVDNPEKLRTTYQRSDRDGQILAIADPNKRITEIARDAFGRPQQIRGPDEESTTHYHSASFSFDVFDIERWAAFEVSTTSVGQGTTNQFFDVFGNPVQVVTPGFQTDVSTELQYDDLGRLIMRTLPHAPNEVSQSFLTYAYDGFGRLSTETVDAVDPLVTHYFYPNRATATGVAESEGWFGGDAATAVVVQKPRGNVDVVVRDPFGLAVRTAQLGDTKASSSATTKYTYGAFNVLHKVEGPVGTTSIIPDTLGRPGELDDPSMGPQIYVYDGFDEVTLQEDGNNKLTRLEYDRLGRTTALRDGDNDLLAKWTYDGSGPNELGRLVAMYRQAKPGASTGNWVRYHYQAPQQGSVNRGLLESINHGIGGTPDDSSTGDQFEIGYEYQAAVPWRLDILHYPDAAGAFAVQHDYDASGALKSVHAPGSNVAYWTMLSADQGIRLKQERFGDGLLGTRDYFTDPSNDCASDPTHSCIAGSLKSIGITKDNATSNLVQSLALTYDLNGNLSHKTTAGLIDINEDYFYDPIDRLADHERTTGATSTAVFNTYDGSGNILTSGDTTYHYDDVSHPLQVTGIESPTNNITYKYDGNGNLKDRAGNGVPNGSQHYEYNDFNMPWQIVTGTSEFATVTELEYDALGTRLIKRKVNGAVPAEVTLSIGDLYDRTTEYDNTGKPTTAAHRYHIYAGGREVAQARRSENSQGVTTEDTLYIHDDAVGSTSLISNADQSVLERREFTPFGEAQSAIDFGSTGVLNGFTGSEHDPDLGLINMRGRLYDPSAARFTTPDPFVTEPFNPQGLHRYAYVHNNPLNYVDPTGFTAEPPPIMFPPNPQPGTNIPVVGGTLPVTSGGQSGSGGGGGSDPYPHPGPSTFPISDLGGGPGGPGGPPASPPATTNDPRTRPAPGPQCGAGQCNDSGRQAISNPLILVEGAEILGEWLLASADALIAGAVAEEVLKKPGGNTIIPLYHYSSKIGVIRIVETQTILPSVGPVHARYGGGQYFTDISPKQIGGATKEEAGPDKLSLGQVARMLFGQPWAGNKLEAFVEIDVGGLHVVPVAPHIFLVPNEAPLGIEKRLLDYGLVR
jgi:RHS repeat-associated protein